MNYDQILQYFPFAKAVYGGGDAARTPLAVGNIAPVVVDDFKVTLGSGFGGALYKDPTTGKYTIAFVGSEVQDFVPDWIKADGTLATQDLFNAARNFRQAQDRPSAWATSCQRPTASEQASSWPWRSIWTVAAPRAPKPWRKARVRTNPTGNKQHEATQDSGAHRRRPRSPAH